MNPILNATSDKPFVYKKNQDMEKDEDFYRILGKKIIRESDQTITLKITNLSVTLIEPCKNRPKQNPMQ